MVVVIASIVLALVIIMGIVMVLVARKRVKEGLAVERSYRGLYIFGIIVVPVGIVLMAILFVFQIPFFIGLPLFVVGLTYLIIGLANRSKWEK